MTTIEELLSLYSRCGAAAYFGESVSIREHSLQAAYFAQASGAKEALVVAALLHDVGHLIDPAPDDIAEWVSDAHHEESGSRWLAKRFGPEVCEPVRLHVPAKRYLCGKDWAYFKRLSAASVLTLKRQGGPMSEGEIAAFETEPYHGDAVLLRHFDDQGKISGLRTPDFQHYAPLINRLWLRDSLPERSGG